MTPTRLYVNIDHVATVRQARRADEPDPLLAAADCEAGGADGITVHLREDRRHIQDHDVIALAERVQILNLELATSDDVVALACRLRPYQATLVPERREEITTEGGLNLSGDQRRLEATLERLGAAGSRLSLFIDPDHGHIDRAKSLGATAIELHTGRYANTWHQSSDALDELAEAARYATQLGLAVHAGHGLTYRNVQPVARIPEIEELNIGHSIVSRAIFTGIQTAVKDMVALVRSA